MHFRASAPPTLPLFPQSVRLSNLKSILQSPGFQSPLPRMVQAYFILTTQLQQQFETVKSEHVLLLLFPLYL